MRMCGVERRHTVSSGAQTHGQGGRKWGGGSAGGLSTNAEMDRLKTPLLLEISSTPSQGEQCGVV